MSRCKHCGAQAIPLRKVCDYCGTPQAQGYEYPVGVSKQASTEGNQIGFQRLLAHPELQALLSSGPRAPLPTKRSERFPRGLAVCALFAFIFWKSGAAGQMIEGFLAVPLIFVVVAFLVMVRRRGRDKAFPGTHVESIPARILGTQNDEIWPKTGWVRVTIEQESGERRLLRYRGLGSEAWKESDFGVAHIKANVLVEFNHLRSSAPTL
jgi:hypothetical protein